jgi:RNA polymerase sigma-70 factor (ECF subfamily)
METNAYTRLPMPSTVARPSAEITPLSEEMAAIAAVKRRDPGGLDWLVRAHQLKAIRTAYLVLGDRQTAEDMVADAFVTVFHKIDQFDSSRPFWPWFCRIVMNNALGWLRKNKATQAWDDALPIASDDKSPHERAESGERVRRVLRAISALAPEQRAVVVMRYYHGLEDREIADALGIPHATVRWRMHWSKKKLRAALDKDPVFGEDAGAWEQDV